MEHRKIRTEMGESARRGMTTLTTYPAAHSPQNKSSKSSLPSSFDTRRYGVYFPESPFAPLHSLDTLVHKQTTLGTACRYEEARTTPEERANPISFVIEIDENRNVVFDHSRVNEHQDGLIPYGDDQELNY